MGVDAPLPFDEHTAAIAKTLVGSMSRLSRKSKNIIKYLDINPSLAHFRTLGIGVA